MLNIRGKDIRVEALEEIKNLQLPIYLWGGQVYGEYITEYLRENDILDEIKIVVDDEYITENGSYMPLSEYLDKYADNSIMIFAFYNYGIVQRKYKQYKSKIKHLYDFRITHVGDSLVRWDQQEALSRISEYNETYTRLKDDKSRDTMQLYLRAAVNGEFQPLWEECYEKIAYFNTVTDKLQIDTLVDCGAFNGDDIHDFVVKFPNYKKIYAIEPDAQNVVQLNRRIEMESMHNIEVISKGVYKESTVLHFSSDQGVASHLNRKGDIVVPVIALDELLKHCTDNILIKMDIEGSEMDALAGAAETIKKKHPCLAICVYHKEDDLITIPKYIDNLVEPDIYDYYLRFHGLGLAELVFYAIPKMMSKQV